MIYVCEFDETLPQERLRELAPQLGVEWKGEALTGRKLAHVRERVIARLLLLKAVRREYGIRSLAELELDHLPSGKPYSKAYPKLYFNLSHTQAACACVLGERQAGVDVERRFPFRESLARKICCAEEAALLQKLDQEGQERLLPLLWAMKESFVKWDGHGLAYGMDRVNLAPYLEKALSCVTEKRVFSPLLLSVSGGQEEKESDLCFLVQGSETYTLSVCESGDPGAVCQVTERELADL